jgi:uncharacterized protein involved in response to NO
MSTATIDVIGNAPGHDRTVAAIERERGAQRLVTAFVFTGLGFMLLPGTFLGVWNLISISQSRSLEALSPAWIQAHGHAQIFGWVGTFILGIGLTRFRRCSIALPFR